MQLQGGTPNRETEGTIWFNNDDVDGHHKYWLDPTPSHAEEYASYSEYTANLGSGPMNVGRIYSNLVGDPPWRFTHEDLVTVALHEIGHALGMSMGNHSFIAERGDGDIDVQTPRPFAGATLPLAFNNFGVTSHLDGDVLRYTVMAGQGFNERRLITAADIVANAELSEFTDLGLVTGVDGPGRAQAPPSNAVLACGPNPIRLRAAITYRLGTGGPVRVRVVNVTGQVVRTLADEEQGAGSHVLEWRGDTQSGGRAPSGLYVLQIVCPDGTTLSRKITVLR